MTVNAKMAREMVVEYKESVINTKTKLAEDFIESVIVPEVESTAKKGKNSIVVYRDSFFIDGYNCSAIIYEKLTQAGFVITVGYKVISIKW